ncbi:MAG TPA: ADP-ribosylglycohydrolase family protein, partial [Thermoanaerobaculia bacterium]|nr:ADP-ribosylglycohydrolase family protein [Thermoanaerobaculia bacterium]
VAPVGLLPHAGTGGEGREIEGIFRLGVETAALTHGHVTGQLPAGVLAAALFSIVHEGRPLDPALDAATGILRNWPHHGETLRALERAREVAARGTVTPERIESLGGGWIAEEALAIAVAAALAHPGPAELWEALVLAANHGGDSDSTAAIAGNLLGALHGVAALPAEPLAELEGREAITRLADDFVAEMTGTRPRYDLTAPEDGDEAGEGSFAAWWKRYPGW